MFVLEAYPSVVFHYINFCPTVGNSVCIFLSLNTNTSAEVPTVAANYTYTVAISRILH